MQLTSPAFLDQSAMPINYTCKGANINPELHISDVPAGTQSLAFILHDPDAPNGDFLHWSVWNIDPATTIIAEQSVPAGSLQGRTDFGAIGYGGPCPPSGTHRYIFELYALSGKPLLHEGASRADFQAALQGQILQQASLTGLVSA